MTCGTRVRHSTASSARSSGRRRQRLDAYTDSPYDLRKFRRACLVHTIIETPSFLSDAATTGMSEDERRAMVATIANDPIQGDPMKGTGGARKVRFAGRGKGKSGGYRVVTYYAGPDV